MAGVEGVGLVHQEGHFVLHRSQLLLQLFEREGLGLVHLRVDLLDVDGQPGRQVFRTQADLEVRVLSEGPPEEAQEQLL